MPVIPQYDAREGLETGRMPQVELTDIESRAAAGLGRAIQGIGQQLGEVAEHFAKRQQQQQELDARFAEAARDQDIATHLQEAEKNMPPDGAGFEASNLEKLDEIAKKRIDSISDPARRALALRKWQEIDRPGWRNRLAEAEWKVRSKANEEKFAVVSQNLQLKIVSAGGDPATSEAIYREGVAEIEKYPFTPLQKQQLLKGWEGIARSTEAQARFRANPAEMSKAFGVPDPSRAPASRSVVDRIVGVESGGRADARNPNSSAVGAGQFIGSTWIEMIRKHRPDLAANKAPGEILAMRTDANLSREMVARYAEDNARILAARGVQATPGNIYLAHFLGPETAARVARAAPGADVGSIVGGAAVRANRSILAGKTAGDVVAWSNRKMGGVSADAPAEGASDAGPAAAPASASDFMGSRDPRFDVIPVEQKMKMLAAARTEANSLMVRHRADVTAREADAHAAFVSSGSFQGAPSLEEFTSAFGPDEGQKRWEKLERSRALGTDLQSMQSMTPQEIAATVANYRAQPVPGFRDAAQRQQIAQKAAESILQRRAEDPAAEAIRTSPAVRDAYQAYQQAAQSNDPNATRAAARAYAVTSLAEQQRLGVASGELLPAAVVSSMQAEIARSLKTGEGGQQVARRIQSMADSWGEHWPAVFGQLAGKDGLPGTALMVGAMNRPEQRRAAEQLAEAASIGKQEIEKALVKDDVNTLKEDVNAKMRDFAKTLAGNVGAERTFATFHEGVYLLSLAYMRQGDAPSRASQRAYDDVLGKKYHPLGGEPYRIPIERNRSAVISGAARVMDGLDALNVDVPQWLGGNDPQHAKQSYLRSLRSQAYWVTAPDESGLALFHGAPSVMSAVTSGGKPVIVKWEDLERRQTQSLEADPERPLSLRQDRPR